ncbi:TetR/AcrR family transcriptional regulator [Paraburkholderia phenazinium]|uniref:Transcriptional regulator, TetR family n=1 Tax=Paraburkholderia phenazinium TaxID=60549 RepID=A0A1N6H2H5_9BURK|nr:TetR/AcrR family transcriptional regulator [Paraburkholderia phenazinium]SIO13966.1 transcriptional regulator, TetR family [Paraburkholderia phenazinium]
MGITERKTRQKQALRERILDAARRIVVREGFAALSMRKIADAIEYSPATLYLYFASRDEIARALCTEGYAQLLATFEPLAQIADPAERLKAMAHAYVGFGVAHPQTYRLIFMEDPTYMGAALGAASEAEQCAGSEPDKGADKGADKAADKHPESHTQAVAALINPAASDDSSDAAMRLMVSALDELKAAGRLRTSAEGAVFSQVLWATLHGIVALNLTCPVFPTAPLGTIIDAALDAWFGEREPPAASRDAPVVVATAANDIPADGPAAPATPSATAPRARRPAAKRKAAGA